MPITYFFELSQSIQLTEPIMAQMQSFGISIDDNFAGAEALRIVTLKCNKLKHLSLNFHCQDMSNRLINSICSFNEIQNLTLIFDAFVDFRCESIIPRLIGNLSKLFKLSLKIKGFA